MVYPWDAVKQRSNVSDLSDSELLARYRAAKKRVGLYPSVPPR